MTAPPGIASQRLLRRLLWPGNDGARLARPFDHRRGVLIEHVAFGDEPPGRCSEAAHVVGGTAVALLDRRAAIADHHALQPGSRKRMREARHVAAIVLER